MGILPSFKDIGVKQFNDPRTPFTFAGVSGALSRGYATAQGLFALSTFAVGLFGGRLRQKPPPVPVSILLEPGTSLPVVYGTARVDGRVADWFLGDHGTPLNLFVAFAHGSRGTGVNSGIESIEEIWMDGNPAQRGPQSGRAAVSGMVAPYRYSVPGLIGNTHFQKFLGTVTQNIGATDVQGRDSTQDFAPFEFPNTTWNATTDKGGGIVAITLRLVNISDTFAGGGFPQSFPTGAPLVSAVIKGAVLEDPRSEVSGIGISFAAGTGIVRASGSWITDGYKIGDGVNITGSTNNNGDVRVTSVTTLELGITSVVTEAESTTEVIRRWAHSDNPALCTRDYLLSEIYGLGFGAADLVDSSFEAAADYCDELVEHKTTAKAINASSSFDDRITMVDSHGWSTGDRVRIAGHTGSTPDINGDHTITVTSETAFTIGVDITTGGTGGTASRLVTQKRFTCNGVVDTSRDIGQNLQELLVGFRGNLVWEQGKLKLHVRHELVPLSPLTLNPSNIIGRWTFGNSGIENRWNLVKATFIDPLREEDVSNRFVPKETQWPPVGVVNNFLASDNNVQSRLDLFFPFTNNQIEAQALCEVLLQESRQAISASVVCNEDALALSVGDRVAVTHPTPAWTAKEFWVMDLQLAPDSAVVVSLTEFDAAAYAIGELNDRSASPNTGLDPVHDAPPPTNVTLDSGIFQDRIRVAWESPTETTLVDYYEVQAKLLGDQYRTIGRVRQEDNHETFAHGARNGQTWQARVRTVSLTGFSSDWVESPTHAVQIHDIPSVTLTLTPNQDGVDLAITNFDADGDGVNAASVEIYARENAEPSGPDPLETSNYFVTLMLPGEGPFLIPTAAGQYVRAFAVPFNSFLERGIPTATLEQQSGAVGPGPTGPPTDFACANCTAGVSDFHNQIDVTWTAGDASSQSRMSIDGFVVATLAAGVASYSFVDLPLPDTDYVLGIQHLEDGVFNPTNPIEITVRTAIGTLGTPQGLAIQTVNSAKVKLTWTAGTDGDEASYVIERSPTGAGTWTQIGTTAVGVLQFTHEDWDQVDTAFDFRVKAQRTGWNDSAFTAAVAGTYGSGPEITSVLYTYATASCPGTGGCGTVLKETQTGNRHRVTWNASGPIGYTIRVFRSSNGAPFSEILTGQPLIGEHKAFIGKCGNASSTDTQQYRVELWSDLPALIQAVDTHIATETGTICLL